MKRSEIVDDFYNLSKIRLIAFDVDGVLTDGGVVYGSNGEEFKRFSSRDGYGISELTKLGFHTAFITGRQSNVVSRRAAELGVVDVFQGVNNKRVSLDSLCEKYNLTHAEIAYMGDDVIDLPILTCVGIKACPNDAAKQVKAVCNFISKFNGGHGAARELCDLFLQL